VKSVRLFVIFTGGPLAADVNVEWNVVLKLFILVLLALLAVYFFFPETGDWIASEVSSPSFTEGAPAESEATPGAEMLPSDTTELEIALLDAVRKGDEARARELLSQGANVNGRDTGGETPLIVASSSGHVGLMRLLLDEGASVDGRDSRGRTALLLVCARGRAPEAAILLRAGADPELASKNGNFPLLEAARFGDPELVRSLLSAGAEVNQRASNDWTALKAARERGHSGVADLLRNAGGME
jgi:ankyrin repeat protein